VVLGGGLALQTDGGQAFISHKPRCFRTCPPLEDLFYLPAIGFALRRGRRVTTSSSITLITFIFPEHFVMGDNPIFSCQEKNKERVKSVS